MGIVKKNKILRFCHEKRSSIPVTGTTAHYHIFQILLSSNVHRTEDFFNMLDHLKRI